MDIYFTIMRNENKNIVIEKYIRVEIGVM